MTNNRLNDVERAVLLVLADETKPQELFMPFRPIMDRTGLSRDFVRAACRSLTDRSLAEYSPALWDEDGEMRGSGYAVTLAGGMEAVRIDDQRAASSPQYA